MRLPRRVPWASIGELEQVCAWIYEDEHDAGAKVLAVNRLAAWKAITSLPHALESTHALLAVILQDESQQGSTSLLSVRQSYATAIIRLVNGLVDPLQLGAYARSIASIAAQLGLPPWLVELRHAATHEDLPSIELLREAAREAMAWLLNNYFLPTLNPSVPAPAQRAPLRPLSPILKQYKALLKATTRDVSLASKYSSDITRVLRDVERWVAEAKVAASGTEMEWDDGEEGDGRERWALERLCDALLEKGALVPVSKKKRALSTGSFVPTTPTLRVWSPLLTHLQSLHSSFPATLVSRITAQLVSAPESSAATAEFDSETVLLTEGPKHDTSYDRCLAGWANWIVDTWGSSTQDDEEADLRREDVVISLVTALGPTKDVPVQDCKAAQDLLKALCRNHPNLAKATSLTSTLPRSAASSTWQDDDIRLMHERLASLRSLSNISQEAASGAISENTSGIESQSPNTQPVRAADPALPPGWRRIGELDGWKPSPIGVFVGCTSTV